MRLTFHQTTAGKLIAAGVIVASVSLVGVQRGNDTSNSFVGRAVAAERSAKAGDDTCSASIAKCMTACEANNNTVVMECIKKGGSVTGGLCTVDSANCGCVATFPECKVIPPKDTKTNHRSGAKVKSSHPLSEGDPRYLENYTPPAKPKHKPTKKTTDEGRGPDVPDEQSEPSSHNDDANPKMPNPH
ncbi:MAG: hypothetical protein HY243_14650 [Proteobacteria bacterium]|nr:hypothetical protein [Pseudomonadota bacterium]